MAKKENGLTPMMRQFFGFKEQHPDALLLFRCGDFYETYMQDAVEASQILGITLTRRNNGASGETTEMAGFPHHALDTYLPKLIRAGKRVAICDQLEDPKLTKKLVKRGITELVTPGVVIGDNVLHHKENNFLAAIHFDKKTSGIALLDISTGEFIAGEGDNDYIQKVINDFAPKEILYQKGKISHYHSIITGRYCTYEMDEWIFNYPNAREKLLSHFATKTLKGFGIHHLHQAVVAAGAIMQYLEITQHHRTGHITSLSLIDEEHSVRMDRFTVRSLELIHPMQEEGVSLLDVLDHTCTPMGARLLRRWIVFPLKDVVRITQRQEIIQYLFRDPTFKESLREALTLIGDLERIISKAAVGRISPRETVQLKVALSAIQTVRDLCLSTSHDSLCRTGQALDPCLPLIQRISKQIVNDPPIAVNRGKVIAPGYHAELDQLRDISANGREYLLQLQQKEIQATGISSLKIGYNNVFGYYLEVRNTYKDQVPEQWVRKQTLANAERYITEELKAYEEKILGADEKIQALETALFDELVTYIRGYITVIQQNAAHISRLDCLLSLTIAAAEHKYIRPEVNDTDTINIKQGRHPVIETQMPLGESYVPNDLTLDTDRQQIIMITGPNMAGKSALLRQTALIVLMAQMGSFVPAESATIGLVDKIFTRVGASDNISHGESTFMVEMTEAANILNNVTQRSLVLFDELGRGTSTYDGISIAWAIVEYLHEHPKCKARTLFATHYHELNEMEKNFKGIKNYNVSVRETDDKIIFLRKLVRGGSEHSFGIHVADISGMPKSIVKRAEKILRQLESDNAQVDGVKKSSIQQIDKSRDGLQLSFFQLDDPILCQIRDEILGLQIDHLTPMEALNKLNDIKKILTGK